LRGGTFYSLDSEEETTAFILSVLMIVEIVEVSLGLGSILVS